MKTILFAWELGANLGHLTRDLPLARACRDAGYRVVFAVANLRAASSFLGDEDFLLLQAPILKSSITRRVAPVNFPDMLLHEGYDDEHGLRAVLRGWESLFALIAPAVVVYNHAPTALIAARCSGIPVVIIGTGFEIPPRRHPQSSFRPWQNIPQAVLEQADSTVVAQINRHLARRGAPEIGRLADLYSGSRPLLTTFRELDHFGFREEAEYIGPVYALDSAAAVSWESGEASRKVFVYLRASMGCCALVLDGLQRSDAEVICAIPGAPSDWSRRYPKLRLCTEPVDLQMLLPAADVVVAYGAGTIATSLAAGRPVLALPSLAEQYLAGAALEATGAGIMLRNQSAEAFAAALQSLLFDGRYRQAALDFSARYAAFEPEAACRRLLQEVMQASASRS